MNKIPQPSSKGRIQSSYESRGSTHLLPAHASRGVPIPAYIDPARYADRRIPLSAHLQAMGGPNLHVHDERNRAPVELIMEQRSSRSRSTSNELDLFGRMFLGGSHLSSGASSCASPFGPKYIFPAFPNPHAHLPSPHPTSNSRPGQQTAQEFVKCPACKQRYSSVDEDGHARQCPGFGGSPLGGYKGGDTSSKSFTSHGFGRPASTEEVRGYNRHPGSSAVPASYEYPLSTTMRILPHVCSYDSDAYGTTPHACTAMHCRYRGY